MPSGASRRSRPGHRHHSAAIVNLNATLPSFYVAGLAPTLDFAAPIGLDISADLAGGGDAGGAGDGMGDGMGDGSCPRC